MAKHLSGSQVRALIGSPTNTVGAAKTITDATNAEPIVVSSTAHGYLDGDVVFVQGITGNTAANGLWVVANKAADTFELAGSKGNGAYSSGGSAFKISTQISATLGSSVVVTGASNENPIIITTKSPHNLQTGDVAVVAGVGVNTNANTVAKVERTGTYTFKLLGVAGNGVKTTDGTMKQIKVSTVGQLKPHDLRDLLDALHRVGTWTQGSDENAEQTELALSAIFTSAVEP